MAATGAELPAGRNRGRFSVSTIAGSASGGAMNGTPLRLGRSEVVVWSTAAATTSPTRQSPATAATRQRRRVGHFPFTS